jgi:ACT domain-containing protein
MKRVLVERLIDNFEQKSNSMQNNIQNDIIDASPQFTIDTATYYEFKEYVLNVLKQLNSKMKK